MEKTSNYIKFSLIVSILSIIISSCSLFMYYVNIQHDNREHLGVVIYENNKERAVNGFPDFDRFDIVRNNNGEVEYLIKVNLDNNKSVAWFYGYNGPEKLKRDSTNKFFVINKSKLSKFSVLGSLINELDYAWFKLWHL